MYTKIIRALLLLGIVKKSLAFYFLSQFFFQTILLNFLKNKLIFLALCNTFNIKFTKNYIFDKHYANKLLKINSSNKIK